MDTLDTCYKAHENEQEQAVSMKQPWTEHPRASQVWWVFWGPSRKDDPEHGEGCAFD